MRLVVDTNILIAAVKKDGLTRQLLQEVRTIYASDSSFLELSKYFPEADVGLFNNVVRVPQANLLEHIALADHIMSSIDPDDAHVIACALAIHESVIWSNDKHLKEQRIFKVITTSELLNDLKTRPENPKSSGS
jgi:predicted nucleic acid-binding protein